jgi:hypothetical protein
MILKSWKNSLTCSFSTLQGRPFNLRATFSLSLTINWKIKNSIFLKQVKKRNIKIKMIVQTYIWWFNLGCILQMIWLHRHKNFQRLNLLLISYFPFAKTFLF